jgi:hypothetical protein
MSATENEVSLENLITPQKSPPNECVTPCNRSVSMKRHKFQSIVMLPYILFVCT